MTKKAARLFVKHVNLHFRRDCCFQPFTIGLSYLVLITAPVTVAKNERSFSKMKIIRNFLRSSMSGEGLEDLIVVAAEKDLTDQIDLDVVVKAWEAKKNRNQRSNLRADWSALDMHD